MSTHQHSFYRTFHHPAAVKVRRVLQNELWRGRFGSIWEDVDCKFHQRQDCRQKDEDDAEEEEVAAASAPEDEAEDEEIEEGEIREDDDEADNMIAKLTTRTAKAITWIAKAIP